MHNKEAQFFVNKTNVFTSNNPHTMIEALKSIIYLSRRFKLATTFNLMGLIAAFASFYLIMTQVIYQATYNHCIKDYERIYRLDTDFMNNHGLYSDEIFYPFADALNDSLLIPYIESVSLHPYIYNDPIFAHYYYLNVITKNKKPQKFIWEDRCNKTAVSTIVSKKGQVLCGNVDWTEKKNDPYPDKRGVIIPQSIAQEYFGSTDVAGDSIAIDPSYQTTLEGDTIFFTIRGVYKDFPENSEFLNCIYHSMDGEKEATNKHCLSTGQTFKCYIKFHQVPNDVNTLNKNLKQAIINLINREGWDEYAASAKMSVEGLKEAIDKMNIRLTPLKESYFATKSQGTSEHGFKPMIIILAFASLLLLFIAEIHFLNFTLIESPMRTRGINTRLVLGSTRISLRRGILAECVITTVSTCAFALILCSFLSLLPHIEKLIDGNIAIWHHPFLAICTLFTATIIGFTAGLYPSHFVTSIVPAMALKSNFGLTSQGHILRKMTLAFQLFISFLMVIYLGILIQEEYYIYHTEYGFNKDCVLISTLPLETSDSTKQLLYNKLIAIPGVKNVSFSDGSMGLLDNHGIEPIEIQGHSASYEPTYVDSTYIQTMGIKMIEGLGRNFSSQDTAAAIINKSAYEQWSWIKIGQTRIPTETDSVTIVGVCENVRYNTTRINSNQPFIFIIEPESTCTQVNVGIEQDANLEAVQKAANDVIQRLLRDSTNEKKEEKLDPLLGIYPTPLISFDEKLEETYENEFRFFNWIFILSGVCTLITLIGVLCLTLFESEYRRKEIGIRKVVGATTGEIVGMLCKQYIPLILLSFAIAVPIARYSGLRTLEYFADHTTIPWWIYPMALLIVGGIVMSTILLQSWRTARENPVHSIRAE